MSGDPKARCTAQSRTSGEQCKQPAIPGGTVCRFHGGRAPQVAAAAEQRELERKADDEIRKIWGGLGEAAAVTDPVGSLSKLAGALEQAVDVLGAKVNQLGNVAAGTSLAQLRGEAVLFERLLSQLRQTLDAMARLGVAEKQIELQQEQAQLVTSAFLAALGVISLLPADRDLMLRTFLAGLGRGPEQLEQVTA